MPSEAYKDYWSPENAAMREKQRRAWVRRAIAKRAKDEAKIPEIIAAYDKARKKQMDEFIAKESRMRKRRKTRTFKSRR